MSTGSLDALRWPCRWVTTAGGQDERLGSPARFLLGQYDLQGRVNGDGSGLRGFYPMLRGPEVEDEPSTALSSQGTCQGPTSNQKHQLKADAV